MAPKNINGDWADGVLELCLYGCIAVIGFGFGLVLYPMLFGT